MEIVLIVDLPAESVAAFREYEDRVLPLLSRHGGRLERRLRTEDGLTEVHLLSFVTRESYDGYLRDPERLGHRLLVTGVPMEQRLLEVTDV